MRRRCLSFVMSILMLACTGCGNKDDGEKSKDTKEVREIVLVREEPQELVSEDKDVEVVVEEEKPVVKNVIISAVGDCTLGTDVNFGYENSFVDMVDDQNRDFGYFFSGVYGILSGDDVTIANLETTFTNSNNRVDKTFNFKGDKDYTNILTEGSVEVVNVANNHTYDYGEEGFNDTIEALNEAGVPYFGYGQYTILDVEGVKVGLAGLTGWNEEVAMSNTDKAIEYLKGEGADLIIMTYHWGIEGDYQQSSGQERIARHAIEQGADLVVGHHPHVLQGIECYKGKYIVYSLGNFCFGGNKNPKDKDTMIFQQTFHYEDGVLTDTVVEIYPCSLSSVSSRNDYKPVLLEGEERGRVMKKVLENSTNFDYEY